MGNHFFTADLHLGHNNILKYCKRPFDDLVHMQEELRVRWNKKVGLNDIVWVLGDVTLKNILVYEDFIKSLHGKKILIAGNHDRCFYTKKGLDVYEDYVRAGFSRIHESGAYWVPAISVALDEVCSDKHLLLSHYPAVNAVDKKYLSGHEPTGLGKINLCGHVHNAWRDRELSVNIGIDVADYAPLSASEVASRIMEVRSRG